MVGVDIVGEDDVDTFLGPNKKHLRRNVLDGDGADGKVDSGEELPNWEDRSIDVESCANSSIRYDLANIKVYVQTSRSNFVPT